MLKTRRQKQSEALARRERDLTRWNRAIADEQAKDQPSERKLDELKGKAGRAIYDVQRLKLSLGMN